MTDHICRIR
jgi:hypothetical protein